MDINKEPKVLVIAANPFSDINNNGKTLKSIFSQFSKENLFELYFRPQDNAIGDGEYASSYWAVSEMDIIRSIIHLRRHCGGEQHFNKAMDIQVAEDKTYQRFLHGKLKNNVILRKMLWGTNLWNTREFKSWYRLCKPDIVFSLLGRPGVSYEIALKISKELDIPLAVYFTDDYLIHPIKKTLFDKFLYNWELKKYREIINHASLRFCIGDLMCKEYSFFFGRPFSPIMNSVPVCPFAPKTTNNGLITISYFGGLNLNRWKMICRLASIVVKKARIVVYTGQEITPEMGDSFVDAGVILGGFLQGSEVREKMMESDILLHIESDDDNYRSLTALSISTKLPEYMMSSRPIIAFGPQEIASMRLVADNNLGVAVSSEDSVDKQKDKIYQLINDQNLRNELARKAYDYASITFNRESIAVNLKYKLSNVVCEIH